MPAMAALAARVKAGVPSRSGLTARGAATGSVRVVAWRNESRSWSYSARDSGSVRRERTAFTTCISSVARCDSLRSGWKARASRRQAATISTRPAFGATPSSR